MVVSDTHGPSPNTNVSVADTTAVLSDVMHSTQVLYFRPSVQVTLSSLIAGRCPDPGGVRYATRYQGPVPFGSGAEVNYTCPDGSSSVITCGSDGGWGEIPTCAGERAGEGRGGEGRGGTGGDGRAEI